MNEADLADRAGWDAHKRGRADLRDLHWHYRDILRRHLPEQGDGLFAHRTRRDGHMTGQTIDYFPVEDDLLYAETGDPDPADIPGDWTDNTDDGEVATDAPD